MDNSQDTCRKTRCPMWRKYRKECPMFVTNTWIGADQQAKVSEDCAPIRSMLMQQDLHNRCLGIQKSQEEMRNNFDSLQDRFSTMIQQSTDFMIEHSERAKETKERKERPKRLLK